MMLPRVYSASLCDATTPQKAGAKSAPTHKRCKGSGTSSGNPENINGRSVRIRGYTRVATPNNIGHAKRQIYLCHILRQGCRPLQGLAFGLRLSKPAVRRHLYMPSTQYLGHRAISRGLREKLNGIRASPPIVGCTRCTRPHIRPT